MSKTGKSVIISLLCCLYIAAGVALAFFFMNNNIINPETEDDFWADVSATEADYTVTVEDVDDIDGGKISGSDVSKEVLGAEEENMDTIFTEEIELTGQWKTADLKAMKKDLKARYNKLQKRVAAGPEPVIGFIYFPSKVEKKCYMREGLFYTGTNYYLHHAANGRDRAGGQVFVDRHTNPNTAQAWLIHGHHMQNGSRLGRIELDMPKRNFMKDRLIYIYNPKDDKVDVYVTFSVFLFPRSDYVPVQYMYSEQTQEDFEAYVDELAKRSMYKCDYQYTQVISFHTCNRTYSGANLLLSAYKLEDSQLA